jgi:hypothetical protein
MPMALAENGLRLIKAVNRALEVKSTVLAQLPVGACSAHDRSGAYNPSVNYRYGGVTVQTQVLKRAKTRSSRIPGGIWVTNCVDAAYAA